ncbi:LVIVD repeat-containing protein [Porphyromonadaceae bacterium KH3R12]|nr:LVIVD repeat-containing protein [Porphyromonadaceae bacterium KH3R12]
MKKLTFLLLITGLFVLPGCKDYVDEYVTYTVNEPVFMSASEFRSAVDMEGPKPIEKQGKIVFYDEYLYISQPEKGIHIIDNRNPSDPRNIAFIELLGNADMHVRDNMLYADSYVDLVWFDINDPAKPVLKGRKEEVFPEALPLTENGFGIDYDKFADRGNKVVVGWKTVERKELVRNYKPRWWSWGGVTEDAMYNFSAKADGGSVGVVGSMSRFAIYQDNLYTVMNNMLGIFDLSGETPVKTGEDIYVGFSVETIFSYKNCMFMGTPTGMIIYSLEDPLKPERQSMITHVFGCDPVVVENDIAYVTVRSGTFCGQDANELIVVDVSDVKKPQHIVTYNMKNPKGLGIDNGTLFVCDDGLRVFNAENPSAIMYKDNILAHFKDIDGFDVIPFNNVLMMIAEDGIYQYDYTDVKNIRRLSRLPIGK